MRPLLNKVFGEFRMTCFEQGVVKREAGIFPIVNGRGQLHDGGGPWIGDGAGTKRVADNVTEEVGVQRQILVKGYGNRKTCPFRLQASAFRVRPLFLEHRGCCP